MSYEELRERMRWSGDQKPLYVVDGKKHTDFFKFNVNPDDIEAISILIPPSAVKIYGEIARNGAVVITTKKK